MGATPRPLILIHLSIMSDNTKPENDASQSISATNAKPLPKCGASARIDKWLWAARIFKTRSVAADAIKNNRVTVGDINAKPSRAIKVGEIINVKKPPITYSFKVLSCIERRVGAKMVSQVYENITDPKQYELLEMSRISGFVDRARGTGRPTKKDRRALEAFVTPTMFGWDDDGWDDID